MLLFTQIIPDITPRQILVTPVFHFYIKINIFNYIIFFSTFVHYSIENFYMNITILLSWTKVISLEINLWNSYIMFGRSFSNMLQFVLLLIFSYLEQVLTLKKLIFQNYRELWWNNEKQLHIKHFFFLNR